MQISCYSCKKQIRFPADVKIVQCPSCNQIINVEQLQILQIKKLTSWRMVLIDYYHLIITSLGLFF